MDTTLQEAGVDNRNAITRAVDRSRAIFRGMTLVGHRRSTKRGRMYWALPGGYVADSAAMLADDPTFFVVGEPTKHEFRKALLAEAAAA